MIQLVVSLVLVLSPTIAYAFTPKIALQNALFVRRCSKIATHDSKANPIAFEPRSPTLFRATRSFLSAEQESTADDGSSTASDTKKKSKLIPITMLAGFLGSGKTTTLKHLLENTDGIKIGVIVNDVASVNIDAKLIAQSSISATDAVVSDNSINTVELENGCACCSLSEELLTSLESLISINKEFDEIVVELSGVADPNAVKLNWKEAQESQHPVTKLASLGRTVTLVDACTFGSDFMTRNIAGDRDGWIPDSEEEDCVANRQISELLVEQVEAADLLLVNKVDLATEDQVLIASQVAKGLNGGASLKNLMFGRIAPHEFFVRGEEEGEDCVHTSHDHAHHHATSDIDAASDKESAHEHAHSHQSSSCADPDCTDTSHNHNHSPRNTATSNLGISNFVYKSTRPFHPIRILSLLYTWPVQNKDELDLSLLTQQDIPEEIKDNPFLGVLRSKGFCWLAPSAFYNHRVIQDDIWRHTTAMYWSHAGKHFGLTPAGQWWGSVTEDQRTEYFKDNMLEYQRMLDQDFVTEEFSDRRQELVFIGVAGMNETAIVTSLDACLCTDDEMDVYRQKVKQFEARRKVQEMSSSSS